MFVAILGRQPDISLAELEAVFGAPNVQRLSSEAALVESDHFDPSILGGSIKVGRVIDDLSLKPGNDAQKFLSVSKKITDHYSQKWRNSEGKITLGLSSYDFDINPRSVQKTGLIIKSALKKHGVSLRLVPNTTNALSTAVSHNNKLGLSDNKTELIIIKTRRGAILAESIGAQNITAYAKRDHGKPKRDAFVGMLPPKLAQIMLNMALGHSDDPLAFSPAELSETAVNSIALSPSKSSETASLRVSSRAPAPGEARAAACATEARSEAALNGVGGGGLTMASDESNRTIFEDLGGESAMLILDPFCGTGTVLQEALLRGYNVLGSDLSEKMVSYTKDNLAWLQKIHRSTGEIVDITQADAMTNKWPEAKNITAIVCETYLGQPFSAPPSPQKLKEVVGNCNHIISEFLKNIHGQLQSITPLCIAVPAWRSQDGHLTHLPLIKTTQKLGYELTRPPLTYSRPDQVVAREILVLRTNR